MKIKKRIIISVHNGMIEQIITNDPNIEVRVFDFDNLQNCDDPEKLQDEINFPAVREENGFHFLVKANEIESPFYKALQELKDQKV